jgi:6-phosphogluconolactonase
MIARARPLPQVQWTRHASPEALRDAVVAVVQRHITDAVAARGHALIALPGGNTPRPMFQRLASLPLPWSQVTIIPGDDRLVPLAHPLSNTAVLQRLFAPTGARVLPLTTITDDRHAAGDAAEALLRRLRWPLDLMWLGMGGDGHTASIFPGPDHDAALDPSGIRRAVGLRPDPLPPEAPVDRVTLTGSAIAAARSLLLVFEGNAKAAVFERALLEGADSALPIGPVLAARAAGTEVHSQG